MQVFPTRVSPTKTTFIALNSDPFPHSKSISALKSGVSDGAAAGALACQKSDARNAKEA
jgi:hypothetical protein